MASNGIKKFRLCSRSWQSLTLDLQDPTYPYNGFGVHGDEVLRILKKMYYAGNLLKMGLGSILRTMLPILNTEVRILTFG